MGGDTDTTETLCVIFVLVSSFRELDFFTVEESFFRKSVPAD